MKQDEAALFRTIASEHGGSYHYNTEGRDAITIGVALGIPVKRVRYLLEKWAGRGWMDYGVSVDYAWLTDEGYDKAKGL